MEKLFKICGWWLVTLFFLAIAWATSEDEKIRLNNLPLTARVENGGIWIKNESTQPLSELNMVLNGIFSHNGLSLAANAELRIPLSSFADRNLQSFPASEKPFVLEVFHNGDSQYKSGGYSKFEFD